MDIKGSIHSIETFGTVDGPGIRYVVFMQGCPLRCKYCHNRDTWERDLGKEYTVDEIINDIKKYMPFIESSNGGLTVSGGEPTLQALFVENLFKKAKLNNIHTALDTSGYVDIDVIEHILKYTDLVLLDIKHIDRDVFRDITGVYNDKTLSLAKYLSKENIPVWIRYVLVPGITDKKEDIIELCKFISKLNNVEKFEMLPYHTMATGKWEELGYDYPLKGVREATEEDIKRAESYIM